MSKIERLEADVAEAERELAEADAEIQRLLDSACDIDVSTEGRDGRRLEFQWPSYKRVTLR